jgi:HD-like signal output (HDOD) protein
VELIHTGLVLSCYPSIPIKYRRSESKRSPSTGELMKFLKRPWPPTETLHTTHRDSAPPVPKSQVSEDDYLLYIHKICPIKNIAAGEILVENQKSIDVLYILPSGSLEISISSNGTSFCLEMKKDELFGFMANNADTSYTIRAKIPSTLIIISQRIFINLPNEIKQKLYERLHNKLVAIFSQSIEYSNYISDKNAHLISYIHSLNYKKKSTISSELIQNIIKKIPKLPIYASDLLEKLTNENTSIQEIAAPIQKDPALAGIVLKTVNSSYYGLQRKIADVHNAILYLGFNNVYQIILNHAVKNIISDNNESNAIQIHSTLISIISHEISILSNKSKPLTMMTIGLLHDIGKMVVLLLKRKYPNIQDLLEMLDDAAIGASLLQSWGLPDQIFQSIENHRLPEFCPPGSLQQQYKDEIVILYLAHVYCDMLTDTYLSSTIYLNDYLSLLGIAHNGLQLYEAAILPALLKNQKRLPDAIRAMLQDKGQPSPA